MFKILLFTVFMVLQLYSAPNDELSDLKEKNEVSALKAELTTFYNRKEKEYQKNKKELENLLKNIEAQKNEIKMLKEQNEAILKDIKGEIDSKTTKIYDTMKPKVAASILNKMMNEGNIEDVFDIIIKLKEQNVTNIMRYLEVENAAAITEKLENKGN